MYVIFKSGKIYHCRPESLIWSGCGDAFERIPHESKKGILYNIENSHVYIISPINKPTWNTEKNIFNI